MPYCPTTVHLTTHTVVRWTVLAMVLLALSLPASALARGGGEDVRVAGSCGRGASAELRVRTHHGALEVEYRVRRGRSGERWSVALVHERRVAWRGRATTSDGGDGFRIRRTLPDFAGADEITARASGPRGLTCTATAVLRA
ncbi:MAG TPA: hypothetical protein VKB03_03200 [Conexibacter sp.]|nr:hypothetical protein [Conexibacter sp.]